MSSGVWLTLFGICAMAVLVGGEVLCQLLIERFSSDPVSKDRIFESNAAMALTASVIIGAIVGGYFLLT